MPRQEILPPLSARPRLEIGSVDEAGLAAALTAAAGQGFDLSREIPLRAHLFELADDRHEDAEHVLLIVLHHIAGDGWSLGPLSRDLAALYRARREGVAAGLSPLPVQYADYTLWQQAALGDENDDTSALARQLSFWTQALQDLPDQIELPADRPRPAVSSHRGGHVALSIGADLHRGLAGLARETGVEPVHGAAGGSGRTAEQARGRHRHRDRQPDRGPHRCGAGRSDRVLRQHAGAAHRHLGAAELPRADRPGAGPQPCGLRPPGAAVRAAGRGAQPGAVAVAASAVPGDAGVRGGRSRCLDAGAAGACGHAAADRDREREVRSVGRAH